MGPPQSGQASGKGASWTSSTCPGGGRWGLGAIVGAGLPAGLLRVGGGRSLGEGGGLALAGALLLFEQARQALDLGFQLGDAALKGLAAGAGGFVHEGIVGKREARSCASPEKSRRRAG